MGAGPVLKAGIKLPRAHLSEVGRAQSQGEGLYVCVLSYGVKMLQEQPKWCQGGDAEPSIFSAEIDNILQTGVASWLLTFIWKQTCPLGPRVGSANHSFPQDFVLRVGA